MPQIANLTPAFAPLGLGCSIFDPSLWSAERETQLLDTMQTALAGGINHFDTASGYGSGASESLIGRFLAASNRRSRVFLVSKANIQGSQPAEMRANMLASVRESLARLQTEQIDLYYIHWPRKGLDLRPAMEGLEDARRLGLVRAVGVSNFNAEQLAQAGQAGTVDALQIPYNLFFRFAERETIPYCLAHNIGVVSYGSAAMGILTGKFPLQLNLPPDDQRNRIIFFKEPAWPRIHAAVEELKALAQQAGRPLIHLAARWTAAQPGLVCALVGANNPQQARENAAALSGSLDPAILSRMTEISDTVMPYIPAWSNPYDYNP